jgi:hypothetical protein
VADGFSILEKNIMKAKGLSDADIAALAGAGIGCRQDFQTVGDAATLRQLVPDIGAGSAEEIMEWATGRSSKPVSSAPVVVDTADVVHCVHCGAKQPKDYKSGDLCTACGKQAEPVYACYWCAATGPGRFAVNAARSSWQPPTSISESCSSATAWPKMRFPSA